MPTISPLTCNAVDPVCPEPANEPSAAPLPARDVLACHPDTGLPAAPAPDTCEAVPACALPFLALPPTAEEKMRPVIDAARGLASRSPKLGTALLEGKASAEFKAGRSEEAGVLYRELLKAPWASRDRHLLGELVNDRKESHADFNEVSKDIVDHPPLGNKTTIDSLGFRGNVGSLAEKRLQQIDQVGRMELMLGRSVELHDVHAARDYFRLFSGRADTGEVAREFQTYLRAAFAHSGQGVEWTPSVPPDARAGKLSALLSDQPEDAAGRRLVDCEGFAYLTEAILGGVEQPNGAPRFDVFYAAKQGHVIATVSDLVEGEAFAVNNDRVTEPRAATFEELPSVAAASLCGAQPDIFRFSRRPSQAEPAVDFTPHAAPVLGALIWNGERVTGTVDASLRQSYEAFIHAKGFVTPTYRQYFDSKGGVP